MRKLLIPVLLLMSATAAHAAELKVHLLGARATDDRKAFLTPHWENWKVAEGASDAHQFGDVRVKLSGGNGTLHAENFKALIENGIHMSLTGMASDDARGEIVLTISGLTPGKHTLATYHNEIRDIKSPNYDILINDVPAVTGLTPTWRIANDYDAASTYLRFDAVEGKDVVVRIRPSAGSTAHSTILNGFEIDASDPHKKAIKPLPLDDEEHQDPDVPLAWTAGGGALSHMVYFGADPAAVEAATPKSPEFKVNQKGTKFDLPKLDLMQTYYWRVDEVSGNDAPVKGELWNFRPRMLAFPTAEGYGRFARGGRGGRVIEVTNLEDYDAGQPAIPGSYRAAIEAEGPRTVIFRVSGLIKLKRQLPIQNPFITIAGQTAPGEGICLCNFSHGIQTHDVIIRYIRLRVGDYAQRAMDGMGMSNCDACIIDHCSISWWMDEGTSSRGAHNVTFQWNIVSEGLNLAYHYKANSRDQYENHSFAGSISGDIGSYHHNLVADCTDRNWSLAGGYDQAGNYAGYLDIRNNVVYNWTNRTTDGGVMQLDYVNNYYKPYPKQEKSVTYLLMLDTVATSHGTPKYYMAGNVMEGFDYEKDNWKAFNFHGNNDNIVNLVRVDKELWPSYVKTESAEEAYKLVLENAGANYPKRDVIDQRVVEEVRTGTVHYEGHKGATWNGGNGGRDYPGIIDTQDDVKDAVDSPNAPWPAYKSTPAPVDSDHDGIPDAWEKAHGLNPNDPADGAAIPPGSGYSNLELYLNSLTGESTEKTRP